MLDLKDNFPDNDGFKNDLPNNAGLYKKEFPDIVGLLKINCQTMLDLKNEMSDNAEHKN